MHIACVIFDLDGTLIDSERLCCQAFLDLLPDLNLSLEFLVSQYRGWKLAEIISELNLRWDQAIPDEFEQRYRQRVEHLFSYELRPIHGVPEMLKELAFPVCIASGGPMPKIRQALEVTGLAPYFGERLFSSYAVGSWKPEPGLFLHAAQAMSATPEQCVVVEDSDVGIEAASKAGMVALRYRPDNECNVAPRDLWFASMSELPDCLRRLGDAQQGVAADVHAGGRSANRKGHVGRGRG